MTKPRKIVVETLPVPLTDAELLSAGQDLAGVRLEIGKRLAALKDHQKAEREAIDRLETESVYLTGCLRTRSADRKVEVWVNLDSLRKVVEFVRLDTSEVIRSRPASIHELQMDLPELGDGAGADLDGDAGREPGGDDEQPSGESKRRGKRDR